MKCNLFLETYNSDDIDGKFDVDDNYFKDSQSYIDALNKFSTQESSFMNVSDIKKSSNYAKCGCTLYDDNNEPMTIDKFVGYYNTTEMIMLVIDLDLNDVDDDFDSEFNGWYNSHERLDSIKNLSDEDRMKVEPKMDVKVTFNNLANKETYCTLVNTTFIDRIDVNKYVILVDKIIFTKTF